jgi:hypothetical protein
MINMVKGEDAIERAQRLKREATLENKGLRVRRGSVPAPELVEVEPGEFISPARLRTVSIRRDQLKGWYFCIDITGGWVYNSFYFQTEIEARAWLRDKFNLR